MLLLGCHNLMECWNFVMKKKSCGCAQNMGVWDWVGLGIVVSYYNRLNINSSNLKILNLREWCRDLVFLKLTTFHVVLILYYENSLSNISRHSHNKNLGLVPHNAWEMPWDTNVKVPNTFEQLSTTKVKTDVCAL